MTGLIGSLAVGFFIALFFLNFYFRAKILKVYKVLVNNRIEFSAKHIFNKEKMESEVLSRYPAFRNEILSFSNHIKKSIVIAATLVFAIVIAGFILKNL